MEEINLKKILEVALSIKWIIVGLLVVTAVVGMIYSYGFIVPEFSSSIKLVLTQVQSTSNSEDSKEGITSTDLVMNNQLVSTYSEIIKSKDIMKKVIGKLELNETETSLSNKISVSYVDGTQVLKITVTDQNPTNAKDIATELANTFIEEVQRIYNISNINIIEAAEVSTIPSNINHVKDFIIFEFLGVFIACGIILIIYLLDTTIKDENDIERQIGVSSLGMIPLYKEENEGQRKELLSFENSKSPITECFRTLRTNLIFAKNNKSLKNILTISGLSSEGKSYISANLAMSFARTGKKVLIIDADMRKGRQHIIFDCKNDKGLSNCLTNISKFDSVHINQIAKYVKETAYPNVHIMTSGTRPANPLELISSDKMIELISLLDRIYDYVIIDGTPVNIVSDSIALSKYVDATVFVTEYKKSKIDSIIKVKKAIENVGGSITGIIINKCPVTERAYTEKYYYAEASNDENKSKSNKDEYKMESFVELAKKSNLEDIDFEFDGGKELTSVQQINTENGIDYKLDYLTNEISLMKDIMLKTLVKNNQTNEAYYKDEIEKLRKEIEELKNR